MLRDPVGEWRELSALYEQAELLEGRELQDWLASLRAESHHLLRALERMLAARARATEEGFLTTLPTLPDASEHLAAEWGEGSRVGAYRLVRHIGSGGMAEVWLADRVDGAFERQVAIKLLFNHPARTHRDSFAERFKRERDILASLDHPNIARLHDAGVTTGGQPWLALEYVEGTSITSWCDERRLTVDARVLLFRQVLLAVEFAHANLVIHRDLKPANILVTNAAEVRLLDFGIAKLLEPDASTLVDTELTRASGRLLTPRYASPEQLAGKPLTTASDTYSLGVIFYELILGATPYEVKAPTAAALDAAIANADIKAPSRRQVSPGAAELRQVDGRRLRKQLHPDLDAIALRALHGTPSGRYESVAAFRSDIERWSRHEPVLATVPGPLYRVGKFMRRHRMGVTAAALVSVVLVSSGVVTLVQSRKAQEQATRALASKDFLLDMLRQSDPTHSQGRNVSASELLDAGLELADRTLRDQPELRADVLLGTADINRNLGRYKEAQHILNRASELYAALGKTRDHVLTELESADNALQLGDVSLAASLLEKSNLRLAQFSADAEVQSRQHQVRGWLARAQGDLAKARAHMVTSSTYAERAYGRSDNRTADATRGLAWIEAELNDYDSAIRHIEAAEGIAARSSNATAMNRIGIQGEHARIEYYAGHLARAQPLTRSAIAQCDAAFGPRQEDCVYLRMLEALLLLETGAFREALTLLPVLLAETEHDSSPRRQAEATVLSARIVAANQRTTDWPAVFERLHRMASEPDARNVPMESRKTVSLAVAEVALRTGRIQDAQKALESLLGARAEARSQYDIAHVARAQLLAGLAQQLLSNHLDALSLLNAAEGHYEQAFGRGHTVALLCRLNQIPSLLAVGNRIRAVAVIDETLPILRERLPPRAPVVVKAERAREDLRLSLITIPPSAGHAVFFNKELP